MSTPPNPSPPGPSRNPGLSAGWRYGTKVRSWFARNEANLLAADIVCIVALFLLHLFTSSLRLFSAELASAVQVAALLLALPVAASVVLKGAVPLIICALGIVLLHNAVILPHYSSPQLHEIDFGQTTFVWRQYTEGAVQTAASMHFFLGAGMVAFSMIIAYRPSLLFTKNRPASLESAWSDYPVWQDNALLAEGQTEPSVPVKSLMTDQDRYLLWRYEYVLAEIYGSQYLVRPEGMVPTRSTAVLRDRTSGLVIGKPRHSGYFA